MTAVLSDVMLALIGLSVLAAIFFIFKGIGARSQSAREAYGVGQVEARRSMRIDFVRGIVLVVVGLILLGVYGLSFSADAVVLEPTSAPTKVSPSPAASDTPIPASPTATTAVQEPTRRPTITAVSPTATPATVIEPTEETPATAVVTSEVGVWLRGAPGTDGAQLEWVLGGTELVLLSGLETADDFQWQQVRTPAGNEGWVATDFIAINE